MTRPILVTGGTGTLGRSVVRRLLADGHDVRVMSRRGRPADDDQPSTWATADLSTGAGVDAALDGVRAVVHCATGTGTGTGSRDVDTTRRLTESARRTGCPHLVYISIVGIDRLPFTYYRAKLGAERLVMDSGVPWTVLRATQFHDLVAWMTTVQRRMPVALTLSGVRFQPVDVREVADRLVELALGAPAGRVDDMGGPEVRTAVDLTRACLKATGRRRPVLPLWLPGRLFSQLREGGNLTQEHAVGRGTFDDFLAARAAKP